MRVLRTIASLLTAIALSLMLIAPAAPAAAVAGYNSSYFGESAFVFLTAGQSNQFAAGFTNSGATGWVKGSASQVNLAQCCPINTPSPNSAWAVNWLSSTAYATTTTDYVGPGQIGWFVYTVKAPANATAANYRFDGDLVLASTGEAIHREGYFQVATISGAAPPPGAGVPAAGGGVAAAVSTVACNNLREVKITYNQAMSTSGTTSIEDLNHYTISSGLFFIGGRASSDKTSVVLTVGRSVGPEVNDGDVLSREAATYLAQNGTYTVTVTNVATAGFSLTGSSTTTFTCNDSTAPTVSAPTQPGTYTLILSFSEPMDPTTVEAGVRWDSTLIRDNASLALSRWQQFTDNSCGNVNGCFTTMAIHFQGPTSGLPQAGSHTLEIRDAKDAAGNLISPNPTTFTVTIASDTAAPTISSASLGVLGNLFRVSVNYNESVQISGNNFAAPDSANTIANYVLRNPDGSPATTGGASGSGTAVTVSGVAIGGSTGSNSRFQLKTARITLTSSNGTVPTLRPNTAYTLEVSNVKDEAGNTLAPGTVKTIQWSGDSTGPQAVRAFATAKNLLVDYSEDLTYLVKNATAPFSCLDPGLATAGSTGVTSMANNANYASPNSQFQSKLTSMTSGSGCVLSGDDTGIAFTFTGTLQTGTYELDIANVTDPFGNLISPNPTIIANLTVVDVTKPKLLGAGLTGAGTATTASSLSVKYTKQMKGGATDANSAGNPSNYSIDGSAFGQLCSTGSPTISAGTIAGDGSQVWTITCSGNGQWAPSGTFSGTHSVTAQNLQDLSGNTIDPNPSTATFSN